MTSENRRLLAPAALCLLAACLATPARSPAADCMPLPSLSLSGAWKDTAEPVSLFCLPNGQGRPLVSCYTFGGELVDATIHVLVLDMNGYPVAGFERDGVKMAPGTDGVVLCDEGPWAVHDTDGGGYTRIAGPLRAGGHSESGNEYDGRVQICGSFLAGSPLAISYNSADINGDLQVNLSDIAIFAGDYHGEYNYRSDFYWDRNLDLSDVQLLAYGVGCYCP